MGLDLGVLVLALLVRHSSSFGIFTPLRRCHLSRRAWDDEASHRPFKFATAPEILPAWTVLPLRYTPSSETSRTERSASCRSRPWARPSGAGRTPSHFPSTPTTRAAPGP